MLGDKEYTYAYWQLPPGRIWVKTGDTTPFAAMVYPNLWGYQPDGIYYDDGMFFNTDKNGRPLEDSIALWRLPPSASFACNSCFSVSISNTLSVHYDTNVSTSDVPLAMAAVDNDSGSYGTFGRNPIQRYAYDQSNTCNGPYTGIIYDIVYNAICLQGGALIYDRATPGTSPQGYPLNSVANYVNGASSTRDVCVIRPYVYKGTETPRNNSQQIIPAQGAHPTFYGHPLIDCLTEWPIPSGETYLKSKLENGQGWRSDKVYAPFYYQLGQYLFTTGTNSITSQLEIGFNRVFSVNQIRNGAATIDSGHKITAQFYRCNYEPKYFDDVAYQWENVIFDTVNGVEIQNGMPLSGYASTDTIRFYTRLKILDDKGNNKGKALELAIKHELAFIGLYFCDTVARAQNSELGTGDGVGVYLPEIIDGVTTGRYFTGEDIQNVPYATADSVSGFKYVPDITEDGDFESITNTGTIAAGVSYYALNTTQVNALATWLNTTYLPNDQDEFIQDFKGVNPSDYITTMMFYPFDIPLDPGADVPITVGKLSTGTSGRPLDYKYGNLVNFGNYTFPSYGDFRDYLMKISVFVPFCGTLELDPRLWAGRTMNIKMDIDYPTGACTAYLYRLSVDGKWFKLDSISGTIGVPLPLSSVANGSYQVAITNLLASHKAAYRSTVMSALGVAGGVATAIGGAVTGNAKLALGGLVSAVTGGSSLDANADKMDNIDYNIDHTAPTVSQISGGSPFINCGSDYRVAIFICTPQMLPGYNAGVYGKTTGYATCKQGTLSEVSKGFTRCASAELSGIACTSSERKMIFDSLQSGVYV